MHIVINFALTLVLALVFTLPVTANFFVVAGSQFIGRVAGVTNITEKDVNILPNLRDFNGHVSFSPSSIDEGRYSDTVALKVFQRQKASYNGLYSVYNLSEDKRFSLEVAVRGDIQQHERELFDTVRFMMAVSEDVDVLKKDVQPGDTVVPVDNPAKYKVDQKLMIGSEVVKIIAVGEQELIVTPFSTYHVVGDRLYDESILVTSEKLVHPVTQKVLLEPGDKMQIDAIVEGTADLRLNDSTVNIPLLFKFEEVESL